MLRKENKYMLGTIADVAKELYKADTKHFKNRFIDCDFALVDKENFDIEQDDLEFIYTNSTGWYGIKKIDPGFDNRHYDDMDLFADYYGGGCGTYRLIGDWDDSNKIVNVIRDMIIDVLSYQEGNITGDDVIICEIK